MTELITHNRLDNAVMVNIQNDAKTSENLAAKIAYYNAKEVKDSEDIIHLAAIDYIQNIMDPKQMTTLWNSVKGTSPGAGALGHAGTREESAMVGALSKRITFSKEVTNNIIYQLGSIGWVERLKDEVAFFLTASVIDMRIQHKLAWIVQAERVAKDKTKYITHVFVLDDYSALAQHPEEFANVVNPARIMDNGFPEGIMPIPGVIGAKRLKSKHSWVNLRKLYAREREYLSEKASLGLRIRRDITADELREYAKQRPDCPIDPETGNYRLTDTGKKMSNEASTFYTARWEVYIKTIMDLQKEDMLYLTWSLDYRGRSYPVTQLPGAKLHGDSVEKHIWELAIPYALTGNEIIKAKAAIGQLRAPKKLNSTQALKYFNKHSDELLAYKEDDLGDRLYYSSLVSIATSREGDLSHAFLGEDLSTNGLAVMGSSTGSKDMMIPANLGGYKKVYDAHGNIQGMINKQLPDADAVSRDEVKKAVSMLLFHGSSMATIVEKFAELGVTISESVLSSALVEVFGMGILTINKIAKAGAGALSNTSPVMELPSPDGGVYYHIPVYESERMSLKTMTLTKGAGHKKGFREMTIYRDMPVILDNNGFVMNGNNDPIVKEAILNNKKGFSFNESERLRASGLFANITHMLDAYMARQAAIATGYQLIDVHDNFFARPSMFEKISDSIKESHKHFMDVNYYLKALESDPRTEGSIAVTELKELRALNKGTKKMIDNSSNFLQQ